MQVWMHVWRHHGHNDKDEWPHDDEICASSNAPAPKNLVRMLRVSTLLRLAAKASPVVFAAVAAGGHALQFASAELWAGRQVVLIAALTAAPLTAGCVR